jgi:hypothetical protein
MKTPWTKGPWTLRRNTRFGTFVEAPKAEGMGYALDVCGDDYSGYGDEEQREANMALIALAPELAEAILDIEFEGKDRGIHDLAMRLKEICVKYGKQGEANGGQPS